MSLSIRTNACRGKQNIASIVWFMAKAVRAKEQRDGQHSREHTHFALAKKMHNYLKSEMFLDSESPNEEIILLYIGRDCCQVVWCHLLII